MPLVPKICVEVRDNCNLIVVTDTTQEYNGSSNIGGWDGANVSTTDIAEAYITIISSDPNDRGTRLEISDDVWPDPVTGSFELGEFSDYVLNDGEYTFIYTLITDEEVTYEAKAKIFVTCEVACCIQKLWLKYITEGEDTCSCSNGFDLQDVLLADALYKSLLRAAACLDVKTRDKLLTKLQAICGYTDCNCK